MAGDLFDSMFAEDLALGQTQSAQEMGSIGGGGGGLNVAGLAASFMSGNWVGAGLQLVGAMLQGKTDASQSGAGGAGALNTSGWVVGEGDAQGGNLSDSSNSGMGWQGWALLTVVAVLVIKRMD